MKINDDTNNLFDIKNKFCICIGENVSRLPKCHNDRNGVIVTTGNLIEYRETIAKQHDHTSSPSFAFHPSIVCRSSVLYEKCIQDAVLTVLKSNRKASCLLFNASITDVVIHCFEQLLQGSRKSHCVINIEWRWLCGNDDTVDALTDPSPTQTDVQPFQVSKMEDLKRLFKRINATARLGGIDKSVTHIKISVKRDGASACSVLQLIFANSKSSKELEQFYRVLNESENKPFSIQFQKSQIANALRNAILGQEDFRCVGVVDSSCMLSKSPQEEQFVVIDTDLAVSALVFISRLQTLMTSNVSLVRDPRHEIQQLTPLDTCFQTLRKNIDTLNGYLVQKLKRDDRMNQILTILRDQIENLYFETTQLSETSTFLTEENQQLTAALQRSTVQGGKYRHITNSKLSPGKGIRHQACQTSQSAETLATKENEVVQLRKQVASLISQRDTAETKYRQLAAHIEKVQMKHNLELKTIGGNAIDMHRKAIALEEEKTVLELRNSELQSQLRSLKKQQTIISQPSGVLKRSPKEMRKHDPSANIQIESFSRDLLQKMKHRHAVITSSSSSANHYAKD